MNTRQHAFFSFHGLLEISCRNISPIFLRQLMADHGDFATDSASGNSKICMTIRELQQDTLPQGMLQHPQKVGNTQYITEHEGTHYAVITRGGTTLAVFTCAAPYIFYYTEQPSNYSETLRTLFTYIDLALSSIGAMLCKGAVASYNGNAYVFSGTSGAGKTSLLLQLIRQGWSYLSDNTFILYQGKAYAFRRYIVVHHYHLRTYPDCFTPQIIQKHKLSLRRKFIRWLTGKFPSTLGKTKRIKNMGDPYLRIAISELTPQSSSDDTPANEMKCTPINGWIFITQGQTYKNTPMNQPEARGKFYAIQQLTHVEMARLCQLFALHCDTSLLSARYRLWDENTDGSRQLYFMTQLPPDTIEADCKKLIYSLPSNAGKITC